MQLEAPTFVLERRVAHPMAEIQRGLADRTVLAPAGMIDLESDGFLCINEPLRPVRPYSSRQPLPTWCARGHLLTSRRRVVAAVEIEVSPWSDDATSVTMRPVATRPERWRAFRLRHYFALAHHAADATARVLAERAVVADAAYRNHPASAGSTPDATLSSR